MALVIGLFLAAVSGTAMTVAILLRQQGTLPLAQRHPAIYVTSILAGTIVFATGVYLVLTS